jgi:hypothetical protein
MRIQSHYRRGAPRGAHPGRPSPLARGLLAVLAVMYSFSVFAVPAAHALDEGTDHRTPAIAQVTAAQVTAAQGPVDQLEHPGDRAPSDPHHHDPDCVTCLLLTLPGIEGQARVAAPFGPAESRALPADAGFLLDRSLPPLHLRGPPTA